MNYYLKSASRLIGSDSSPPDKYWYENDGIVNTISMDGPHDENIIHYIEENYWIKNILATDISLDGTLEGPNINIYKQILNNKNLNLIASGGIGSINDINRLQSIDSHECVVGKAIYENKISLMELRNVN